MLIFKLKHNGIRGGYCVGFVLIEERLVQVKIGSSSWMPRIMKNIDVQQGSVLVLNLHQ